MLQVAQQELSDMEWSFNLPLYRKDTEHLYHFFMYSLVTLLSGIYPLHACYNYTLTRYLIGLNLELMIQISINII